MATRKKNTPRSETFKPEETVQQGAQAAARKARGRKPASAAAPGGAEKAAAKPTASAATHKAPAHKPAGEETLAGHAAVERPGFDTALHHEEIAKEAYYSWLRRGCPHGSARADWLAAVALVRARHTR